MIATRGPADVQDQGTSSDDPSLGLHAVHLRASERKGMQFGPHTVTHPILSRAPQANMREELATSWARLRTEAEGAVPIFCYPNGQPGDYGEREVRVLRELGLRAAVTGLG